MKQLKLEVGKTYRGREGEEVEIVDFCEGLSYPYKGNKGKWYAEPGQWCNKESPYDLIEEVAETRHAFTIPDDMKEVTSTRHTFQIPDGVKEITLDYFGNRLVVEMVPEVDAAERCRIMEYLQGYANNVTWNYEQLCWLIENYLKHKEATK